MRELVFTVGYDPGCDPIADALATHPDARVHSLSCHVTRDSFWRVDHASGPGAALDDLEGAYLNPGYCPDCLTAECSSDTSIEVLEGGSDARVFYIRWDNERECNSVPHLAFDCLGPGFILEAKRHGREHWWRFLVPEDADVSRFNAAVVDEVCDCADVNLRRLTEVDSWDVTGMDDFGLPPEQRETLLAAVEHGYYETPRETDLADLSEELDVPRSTLSYRLRRAEARLAKAVAAADWGAAAEP